MRSPFRWGNDPVATSRLYQNLRGPEDYHFHRKTITFASTLIT
ncbi:hypothetical protein ACTXGQ_10590 [Marinobacter sp. 1Y8]